MSNIAAFLNSPSLGGAERSLILQLKNLQEQKIKIYIPFIQHRKEAIALGHYIENELKEAQIIFYKFPSSLYSFSRSNLFYNPYRVIKSVFSMIMLLLTYYRLGILKSNVWWINGNKVGMPILLLGKICKFKEKIIYHLRDYPFNEGLFKYLWKLILKLDSCEVIIVSNSFDVQKKAQEILNNDPNLNFMVCYNPVDLNVNKSSQVKSSGKIIGLASMLVPWKGIHFVINFMNIYKSRLKDIGIASLNIYGENIYFTSAANSDYKNQLLKLSKSNELIHFLGLKSPDEIFEEIDILIHPSLKPEPFGRIIAESFRAHIPVISTGLGGAGELINDGVNAFKYFPDDYAGLFESLKRLVDKDTYHYITNNAMTTDHNLQEQQAEFWNQLKNKIIY